MLGHEVLKHRNLRLAPVVPETELIEVRLQVVDATVLVAPSHSRLEVPPEPFDGVRVDDPTDVFVIPMCDRGVCVPFA